MLTTPETFRTLQRKLYTKAKQEPAYRFYALYDKVWRADILMFAYRLVRANKGSPGVDRMNFEDIEQKIGIDTYLSELAQDLKHKTYRPDPVPDNGGLENGACLGVKNIGKLCAGKPHARFDEGGQPQGCSLLYPPLLPKSITVGFGLARGVREGTLVNPVDEILGIALLKRIAVKDRKAFEEFYYLYAEGFGRFLMKMLKQRDWVDEAVNDVMLTVWQLAERYNPERGRLSTWLFGIAHNKGLKILERARRRREGSLEEYPDEIDSEEEDASDAYDRAGPSASGPERVVMGWELGDAMSWAFSKLSANHRSVIELCFTEDRSYQEIADIMGCPINTVKTRLFHARKRLAESLARKGFSLPEQGKVAI